MDASLNTKMVSGFSKRPFHERFADLGDTAEQKFREIADAKGIRYVDYGFHRPPFKRFYDVPLFIRLTPDFLCEGREKEKYLVEAKGCGSRGLKIKLESLEGMRLWNELAPVWVFVYNSSKKKYAMVSYEHMVGMCEGRDVEEFDDHKEYYTVPVKEFTWHALPQENNDDRQGQVRGY